MNDIEFAVEGAQSLEHAVVPTLVLKLRVDEGQADSIQNILLQCQIQIEAPRRKYSRDEQTELVDLFGAPERWGETLRTMHWTRVSVLVPAFEKQVVVDLQIPCSFDFNLAVTKYFHGLEMGEVPLLLLFSGTIFYREESGALQVRQIPWSKECRFRLPVAVWKQMMDHYYPNSAWICLRRDLFERLYHFKCEQGISTWEQTLENLLVSRTAEMPL
jgi:hypothetical protein